MNVTIEIPDNRAARFREYAESRGLTVDQWLLELAEQNAPLMSIAHLQETDPEEWARRFHDWAQGQ